MKKFVFIALILLLVSSSCLAYTWNEYITFLDSLELSNTIPASYNQNVTLWRTYRTQIINCIETYCNPEDYDSFVIRFMTTGSNTSFNFTGFITNSNNNYRTNSESAIIFSNTVADSYRINCYNLDGIEAFTIYGYKNYTGPEVDCNYLTPRKVGTNTTVWSDGIRGNFGLWLLNNASDTFLSSNNYPTQAIWNYIYTNNYTINNLTENFQIANGFKGLKYANSTINYFLCNNQDQAIQELSYNYYNGRSFNLYCDLTDPDIVNGTYYIKMVDISSNPNNDIYKSNNFNITIFNNSGGGSSGGNIVIGGFSPITNTSGDVVATIDNSNILTYFNYSSGNIMGELSGDLGVSGDAILNRTLYLIDNRYYNLVYSLFSNIINILTSSGNVQLLINYRDFSFVLNSDDYLIPNNAFKIFSSSFLIVGCIYLIYWDLYKQYKHVRELQLSKFLHDTDVDFNMFL